MIIVVLVVVVVFVLVVWLSGGVNLEFFGYVSVF